MLNVRKFYRRGHRHLTTQVTGLVSLVALVLVGLPAQASVTLTRAEVEALRNRVEFIPRGRQARAARMSDFLAVGDALRTAASSQADLRFNDGSLARVGERATFRFVPNTRNFRLTNGTVLLLIPPGQGRTNIQTPSAVTGIQGSAVVVRYVPETDLTLVMALTNNPAGPMTITANNCGEGAAACGTAEYALYGGQMAVIQNNQVQVVEFDLPTFYQTSPLVEGLELDNPNAESPLGPALEAVRAETLEALAEQTPFSESITLNPAFFGVEGTARVASEQPWLLSPAEAGISPLTTLSNTLTPGNSLVTATPTQFPGAGSGSLPVSTGGNSPSTPDPTPIQSPIGGGTDPSGGSGIGIGIGVGDGGVGVGVGIGDGGIGVGIGDGGVGVGVGGDPGNNNGVGPGGNNGVGVGVGGDPGNNNGVGPGGNNGVGNPQPDQPFIPPDK